MTSRPKYNQYLTSNRRQVPAGIRTTPGYYFTLILSASGDPELLALILPQIPTFSRALKIKIKAPLYSCRGGAVDTNDWGFS